MSKYLPESMPMERQAAIEQIANALWKVAWKFDGGVGTNPPLESLSPRNQKRWLGASLAAEYLMSQAKQDAMQQRVVINACIAVLEQYRDANDVVPIK